MQLSRFDGIDEDDGIVGTASMKTKFRCRLVIFGNSPRSPFEIISLPTFSFIYSLPSHETNVFKKSLLPHLHRLKNDYDVNDTLDEYFTALQKTALTTAKQVTALQLRYKLL